MQVQSKIPEPKTVEFSTIDRGEPFKYKGTVMMRLLTPRGWNRNAVVLSDGSVRGILPDSAVEPIKAKVVVEA